LLQFCTKKGGKLAEILDSDESDRIRKFLTTKDPLGAGLFWIGLTDSLEVPMS
jgi:hypothetical protein